jgi:hypothetical protein
VDARAFSDDVDAGSSIENARKQKDGPGDLVQPDRREIYDADKTVF